MKTAVFFTAIASLLLLVNATVWEGVSGVDSASDNSESYSVATNSFPKNTVVDITNLENGKVVRAIVISSLNATGFLAKMSRNAADSLDLHGKSTCRIRMTRLPDDIAFANFRLGPVAVPAPVVSEFEVHAENNISDIYDEAHTPVAGAEWELHSTPAAELAVYTADNTNNNTYSKTQTAVVETEPELQLTSADALMNVTAEAAASAVVGAVGTEAADKESAAALTVTEYLFVPENTSGSLSMIPAEERLPQALNQAVLINAETSTAAAQPAIPANTAGAERRSSPPADFSPFTAPLIDRLERGRWYVQIGVYTRPDHVEDEISKIGTKYPLAIQNAGTETNPLFRILLGPLTRSESGVVLERFKSIGYEDAFVRNN